MSIISRRVFNSTISKRTIRGSLLLIIALFSLLALSACGDAPAGTAQPTSGNATPGATSNSVGSGIQAQAASSGQPLPTPTPPGPDKRKVITLWTGGWKGNIDYEKFLNDQIDNYRVRNSQMTVDWQDFGSDLVKKYQDATSKSSTIKPPDIILLNDGDLYQLGSQGFLADMTALGGSTIKDDYVPATFEALRYGSGYYGLPWVASSRVTIINKKLWQQATLDPAKTPKTLSELDPLLPTIAKNTPTNVIPAWVKPDPLVDFMMEDAPVYTVSGDGKSKQTAFPSPGTIAKLQYYQEKRKQGVFDKDGLTKSYSDALKKYTAGQLVMVMDGAPLLPGLKNSNQDLYNNTLVIPYLTGKANTLPLDIQGWAISNSSSQDQQQEALNFLKYLESPENQLTFAKLSSLQIPTLKKALSDPYVTSQNEPLAQARSIMAATLDRTRPPEQLMPAPLKPEDRDKLLKALYTAFASVWDKNTAPKDALNDAARTWSDVLK
ncbi:MAG TPA: ABC transporter substrate-binding protein [Chloroflexia bacterium]|nr:ABC transporter substrate-binding protein [Chloroflexia bacterium]